LTPKNNASRPDLNACACTGKVLARIGRYLLVLSTLSLLTMPITEHLWNWDRFLQGGKDYELGTLMILLFLCLAVVLSKQCKQCVEAILFSRCVLASEFIDRLIHRICLPGEFDASFLELATSPGTGLFDFPLQI
jgi:hypothetical protein